MNWFYWQVSDCRTLFKMMNVDPRKAIQQDLHDAQADAHWQAVCVQQFFKDFNILSATRVNINYLLLFASVRSVTK